MVGADCNTINFRILWQDNIVTRDHHVMQYVLATGFDEFEKGVSVKLKYAFVCLHLRQMKMCHASFMVVELTLPVFVFTSKRLFDLFGDGIFNTDGAEWRAHRALTRPFFGWC